MRQYLGLRSDFSAAVGVAQADKDIVGAGRHPVGRQLLVGMQGERIRPAAIFDRSADPFLILASAPLYPARKPLAAMVGHYTLAFAGAVRTRDLVLQLGRMQRIWLGRLIALAYLFCVLAPGAALAFGSGPAPCFGDDSPMMPGLAMHMHAEGAMHDHGGMYQHRADSAAVPGQHHHDHKRSPGPCCALLCIVALPASVSVLVKPSLPTSICPLDSYEIVQGKAPPVLYRPPIA